VSPTREQLVRWLKTLAALRAEMEQAHGENARGTYASDLEHLTKLTAQEAADRLEEFDRRGAFESDSGKVAA
jgi:hypothetical protein